METTEQNIYSLKDLDSLVDSLVSKGYRVIAPKIQGSLALFTDVKSGSEISLDQVNPNNSIKEHLFPRSEPVLTFKYESKKVDVCDPPEPAQKTVIIGAKPCDTASLPILDKLFQSDITDKFWFAKRNLTTVISVACDKCDEYCFCSSVGLSPESKKGCDMMLVKKDGGGFVAEVETDKGESLASELTDAFSKAGAADNGASRNVCSVETKFDSGNVKNWLDNNFEDPLWEDFSKQCIGCGACTFLCPTCHCFDIVDEGNIDGGCRLKNWDACQMKMFTMHTSGHNPRSSQDQRWRQRIMHKFRYYVDKFDDILCVGCGRCSRSCPVDMNLSECLSLIDGKSGETKAAGEE